MEAALKTVFSDKRPTLIYILLTVIAVFGLSQSLSHVALNPPSSQASKSDAGPAVTPSAEPTQTARPGEPTVAPSGGAFSVLGVAARSPVGSPTPTFFLPSTGFDPMGEAIPSLEEFTSRVADGQAKVVRGLYAREILALRIVQQPKGEAGFISREMGTATQFQSASPYEAIGLLAHNTLSGRDFLRLKSGQELILVYGDAHLQYYQVLEVDDYQRLTLADPRSNFRELSNDRVWTADQLFSKYYQTAHQVTLQTCLEHGGVWDWGVRFIVARPLQPN